MWEGTTSPVDGNGPAEVDHIEFFLPRKVGEVPPVVFVEYHELAVSVPDELMLCDAVVDLEIGGGVDVVWGYMVGWAGASEANDDVGG